MPLPASVLARVSPHYALIARIDARLERLRSLARSSAEYRRQLDIEEIALRRRRLEVQHTITDSCIPIQKWLDSLPRLPAVHAALSDEPDEVLLRRCLDALSERCRRGRAASMRNRVVLHALARQSWYLVFWTMTIRDGCLDLVTRPGSDEWRKFTERVKYSCGGECDWFAVFELGSQTARPHYHMMLWMRRLPEGARDPNKGRRVKDRRELHCLKTLWPYGHSQPKIVRTGPMDSWGRAGYVWPCDWKRYKVSGEVVPSRNQSVTSYASTWPSM